MSRTPGPSTLAEEDRRVVAAWAARCAAAALPWFEAAAPDDPRPRAAVEAAERFSAGAARVGECRHAAAAAHAAARAVSDPAAVAAARAAGHAAAVAHMAGHALGVAYAAIAASADGGPDAVEAAWRRQLNDADDRVLEVLRRLPERRPVRSGVGAVIHRMDEAVRASRDQGTTSCRRAPLPADGTCG